MKTVVSNNINAMKALFSASNLASRGSNGGHL